MRKILHILITAIFIYNLMGYVAVFQVMEFQAKKEIKKRIKSNLQEPELTVITVTAWNQDELNWLEDDREFIYRQQLYDVVKKETKGETIFYYCINDTREKELFANLNDHIDRHVKNDFSHNKQKKSILQKAINEYVIIKTFSFSLFSSSIPLMYADNFVLNQGYVQQFFPPPEFHT